MYYRERDGQLLKTKIIATMGEPRGEIYSPDDEFIKEKVEYPRLFSWFVEERAGTFMVDVLRLNMAFYKHGENERKIFRWLVENKNGLAKNVAVLGDLPGPKIRLGNVGEKPVKLSKGDPFNLYFGTERNRSRKEPSVLVYDKPFEEIVRKIDGYRGMGKYIEETVNNGGKVTMSIGERDVILTAKKEKNGVVYCTVEKGGEVQEKKGLTIIGANLDIPSFQKQDQRALDFLLKEAGEEFLAFIGISFVKNANDVLKVKHYVEEYLFNKIKKKTQGQGFKKIKEELIFKPESREKLNEALRQEARLSAPSVIAKIETEQAWNNINEILDVADGAMIARGDLGLQIAPQKVPSIQKEIVRLCNFRGKPVIVATEMLNSMEKNPVPTRAESTDVFNAILDGSDAVMLSGETSNGMYPAHAIRMMARIATEAEIHLKREHLDKHLRTTLDRQRFQEISSGSEVLLEDNDKRFKDWIVEASAKIASPDEDEEDWWEWILGFFAAKLSKSEKQRTTDSISESACILSEEKPYSAIIASTLTGRTA